MKKKPVVRRLLAMLVAVCMMVSLFSVSAMAAGENAVVQDDKNGIVQVVVSFKLKNNKYWDFGTGTGFLINDRTVVTANHVTELTDEDVQLLITAKNSPLNGYKESEVKSRMQIRISVIRDVTINAKVRTASEAMDLAVLDLEQAINGKKSIPIRESKDVKQTENCYALGFPGVLADFADVPTYTSDDVNISSGAVNKSTAAQELVKGLGAVDCLIASTKTDYGMSGGPLVDNEGNVIGICHGSIKSNVADDGFFIFVSSDSLLSVIKPLGIEYLEAGQPVIPTPNPGEDDEPTPEPTPTQAPKFALATLDSAIASASGKVESDYTSESYAEMKAALESARNVKTSAASQEEIDAAAKTLEDAIKALKPAGPSMILIIAIAGGAALLLIIILIIVLSKKKSKPSPSPMPVGGSPVGGSSMGGGAVPPVMKPTPSPKPMYDDAGGTSVLGGTGSSTTVLSGGSETTVLGGTSYGKLTRTKTGEDIKINNQSFKLGRQRAAVDYCVDDNSAVGRVHAIIENRGGSVYIKDNNSTNGTFVNKVRVPSNGKTPLNSGDSIMLGDEEFIYKA